MIKKKQGFSVDTMNLWRSYGYDLCGYYLSDARIVRSKWINKDWIEKLSLLINDEQKRKIMGEEGRKFVEENFNWNKIAREFLDIVKKHGIN